jgi:hypothetical protein
VTKTVRTKRSIIIRPLTMAFFVFLNRLFPGILRWLMRITGYK